MKQVKVKTMLLCMIVVMAVLFTACSSKGNTSSNGADSSGNGTNGEKQNLTELTVLLDWYPNAVHSFLYAAEEQGYFREAGLKVNLQPPSDTNDPLKLVAAGKADLALSYQPQIVLSRGENIPVVSVAALVRHPLNHLLVAADSGIQSPKDLLDKKVGYPSIPLNEAIVKTMIKADGGDPAKLQLTDVGWDLIPAMTTKKVDSIIGGYINHEQLIIEKEGIALKSIDPTKYGVPDYYELVLVASEDGLKNKSKEIQAFWDAAKKGYDYTVKNPDKALESLLAQQSKDFPLDKEIEKKSLQILLPLMDAGKEPFGTQSEKSWQTVIDWMKQSELVKTDIRPSDAFSNLK